MRHLQIPPPRQRLWEVDYICVMLHSPGAEDHLAHRPGLVCTRQTIASTLLRPAEARTAIERLHLTIDLSVLPPLRLTILWSGAPAFGHVELAVTTSIIIGSVPGVLAGSLLSSRAPDRYIRPVITFVILASGPEVRRSWHYGPRMVLCATLLGAGAIWLAYVRPWRNADSESGQSQDTIIERVPEVPGSE